MAGLSDRVRAGSEAAPWVVDEITRLLPPQRILFRLPTANTEHVTGLKQPSPSRRAAHQLATNAHRVAQKKLRQTRRAQFTHVNLPTMTADPILLSNQINAPRRRRQHDSSLYSDQMPHLQKLQNIKAAQPDLRQKGTGHVFGNQQQKAQEEQ